MAEQASRPNDRYGLVTLTRGGRGRGPTHRWRAH